MSARPPITRAAPHTFSRGRFAGRTFNTERSYRDELARAHGAPSLRAQQQRPARITNEQVLAHLRPAAREARGRALEAHARMRREGDSLAAAARRAGTTPETVLRYAAQALCRDQRGRFTATARDRLIREVAVPTVRGPVYVITRDSRTASTLAGYWNGVKLYLETGDDRPLRAFRGQSVRAAKLGRPLITDIDVIDRLARAGELAFETMYREAA